MAYFINTIDYKRECGTCSECCQGWLTGKIYDYTMNQGNPCHFVDSDKCGGCCTIYEQRPEMCINYKCAWLEHTVAFPLWMRPDKSKVIVSEREVHDVTTGITYSFWQVKECGQNIDANVLNWVIRNSIFYMKNIQYEIGGQWHYLGSQEFITFFTGKALTVDNQIVPD